MRIRGKDKVPEMLQKSSSLFFDPLHGPFPQEWMNAYEALELEVGCGRGTFLSQMAAHHPSTLFIGIEKFVVIIARAATLAHEHHIENVRFIQTDVKTALSFLPHHSMQTIYLNFSDPWPRRRNDIKRLTHANHLAIYRQLLRVNGVLECKTDNLIFFEWSLQSLLKNGWMIQEIDKQVADIAPNGEEMRGKYTQTEYEQKFRQLHMPIFHVRATPN